MQSSRELRNGASYIATCYNWNMAVLIPAADGYSVYIYIYITRLINFSSLYNAQSDHKYIYDVTIL